MPVSPPSATGVPSPPPPSPSHTNPLALPSSVAPRPPTPPLLHHHPNTTPLALPPLAVGLDTSLCVQGALIGTDTLWRAATGSSLPAVATVASNLLVALHVQLSPLLRSHEAIVREQYLHRCMLEMAGGVAWLSGVPRGECAPRYPGCPPTRVCCCPFL
jgi:hypothetical protein